MSLVIDTEAIRYQWRGAEGQFPEYQKVIPTEFNTVAHFDTIEAVKAVNSFKALSDNPKDYPIDLAIGEGKIVMANPDDTGEASIPADTDGQGSVRVDGRYLAEALKACGGMVDFKLVNAYTSMLFVNDGYQVLVMPLMTPKAKEAMEAANQAKAEAPVETEAPVKAKADKRKRSRKAKELVAVA
jgi:DNA polymerase-3 subunit beta